MNKRNIQVKQGITECLVKQGQSHSPWFFSGPVPTGHWHIGNVITACIAFVIADQEFTSPVIAIVTISCTFECQSDDRFIQPVFCHTGCDMRMMMLDLYKFNSK